MARERGKYQYVTTESIGPSTEQSPNDDEALEATEEAEKDDA